MSEKIEIKLTHIVHAVGLYDTLIKKYGETNLGAKGIANKVLNTDDRTFGKELIKKLLDMGIIECVGVKKNHFEEGISSWGHEPDVDIHTDKTPYYKRGKNWVPVK